MKEVIDALNKLYAGKEFIYKSKYGGETKVTCEYIGYMTNLKFDLKTTTHIHNFIARSPKGHFMDTKEVPTVDNTWSASAIELYVLSEKGNSYEFENCYWITQEVKQEK